MDEGNVSGLHRVKIGGEVASGQPLHHDGSSSSIVDCIGQLHQRGCRDRNALRVTSRRIDPSDAIANVEIAYPFSDFKHAARTFDAKNLRVRRFSPRHAQAHTYVHEIDSGDRDLDEDTSRRHGWPRAIDKLHHAGVADPFITTAFISASFYLTD